MIVYPLFGGAMYYAIMKNRKGPGGFIGKGLTRVEAITNCLKAMEPFTV